MPSSSSTAAAATARPPSSRTASACKPRKPSPSPSPSPATAPKAKKTASGSSRHRRSPLSDLNSGDAASSGARPGCFRFLLPSASGSRSRAASTPRTPAPPDPKARAGNRRRDRVADQESRTRAERCAGQEPRRKGPEAIGAQIGRREPAKKQQWPGSHHHHHHHHQQFEVLTPEKKPDSGATPSTGATPPVHASISPEVAACGSATPACFAAGHHVLPGVGDRRKCRPRGILAIAGEGMTSEELDDGGDAEPSRASIHWLSSPSVEAGTCSTKCGNEASVNWLVSPGDGGGGVDLLEDEIFIPRCSSEDAFWRFSPDYTGLLGSPVLGGLLDFGTPASELLETTPSSGFLPVQKTPSSGDSISPFSLIVKRASASSARLRSLCAQQGLGSSYGSATDPTPISGESWPESISNSKCSGLTRTSSRPMKMMEPVVECLEMMSLSPRPGDPDYDKNSALPAPLPELSFQFAGAPTPLESVDLTSFKRSPRDIELKGNEVSFRKPVMAETRISWREGLVSRIFDMGDLDCCKWLSDDEDAPVLSHNDEALPDIKFEPSSGSALQEGGDQQEACGFGSVEFSCIGGEQKNHSKAPPNPISVAESMRTEGFELNSSDDSDWTLFYKNDLFET